MSFGIMPGYFGIFIYLIDNQGVNFWGVSDN